MRRWAVLLVSLFLLAGCNSSEDIEPIKEETIEFDLEKAKEMVVKREKPLLDLYDQEKLTPEEFQDVKAFVSKQFGDREQEILSIFFIETEEGMTRDKAPNSFYPTIFHQGVEIMDASIHKAYYENDFLNTSYLRVKEAYIGPDERLDDWERAYIFKENKDGQWEMHSFSGTMNFTGEEYDPDTYPIKEGME